MLSTDIGEKVMGKYAGSRAIAEPYENKLPPHIYERK